MATTKGSYVVMPQHGRTLRAQSAERRPRICESGGAAKGERAQQCGGVIVSFSRRNNGIICTPSLHNAEEYVRALSGVRAASSDGELVHHISDRQPLLLAQRRERRTRKKLVSDRGFRMQLNGFAAREGPGHEPAAIDIGAKAMRTSSRAPLHAPVRKFRGLGDY